MLWVIEISKIFEKKTENTNKTEKIYKNVRIILRLHAKQDKIYCIQENKAISGTIVCATPRT